MLALQGIRRLEHLTVRASQVDAEHALRLLRRITESQEVQELRVVWVLSTRLTISRRAQMIGFMQNGMTPWIQGLVGRDAVSKLEIVLEVARRLVASEDVIEEDDLLACHESLAVLAEQGMHQIKTFVRRIIRTKEMEGNSVCVVYDVGI